MVSIVIYLIDILLYYFIKMSLIFITQHNENIYNINKTQAEQHKKNIDTYKLAPTRLSPHSVIKSDNKKEHATMGVAEEPPPDPQNFLKKHTGKLSYTVKKSQIRECGGRICKKLCLPHKGETPLRKDLMELKQIDSEKDFIRDNVKKAKKLKPKEPQHRVVDDRIGTTRYPEAQGLEPVYIKHKIFGKTPKYLVRFNQIKEKEYQIRKDMSGKQQPICRYITRNERDQLLQGLKKNWEELQKQYQGLPILTDTIPKKIKKSKLESDLKQLEKDIVLIERHPYIYVYTDEEFP